MWAARWFEPLCEIIHMKPSKLTQNLDFIGTHKIDVIRRWGASRQCVFVEMYHQVV